MQLIRQLAWLWVLNSHPLPHGAPQRLQHDLDSSFAKRSQRDDKPELLEDDEEELDVELEPVLPTASNPKRSRDSALSVTRAPMLFVSIDTNTSTIDNNILFWMRISIPRGER